jgi:hypothetical protein
LLESWRCADVYLCINKHNGSHSWLSSDIQYSLKEASNSVGVFFRVFA